MHVSVLLYFKRSFEVDITGSTARHSSSPGTSLGNSLALSTHHLFGKGSVAESFICFTEGKSYGDYGGFRGRKYSAAVWKVGGCIFRLTVNMYEVKPKRRGKVFL